MENIDVIALLLVVLMLAPNAAQLIADLTKEKNDV